MHMKSAVKVIAFGWYGAGNVGDELLLATLVDWVREAGGDVVAISVDPAYTSRVLGVDSVDLTDLDGIAREMSDADLFVLGGGGLFQTYQPLTISGLYDFNKPDVAVYARLLMMGRQFGLRTVAWAQGVGPIEGAESRRLLSEVFQNVDDVTVRDLGSMSLLKEIGVERDVAVAPDPIWALPTPPPAAVGGDKQNLRIAMVLRPWGFVPGWEERFVEALRDSMAGTGATLVWIPYQGRSVPGRSASDSSFIQTLIDAVGEGFVHEVVDVDVPQNAVDAMAGCDGLISMRLHAQIVGAQMQLPMLCIEYDEKLSVASEDSGISPDLRLRPDAGQDRWHTVFQHWLKDVRNGVPSVSKDHLVQLREGAELHRQALRQSLQSAAAHRPDWRMGRFDWLGLWSQQRSQRLLEQQDLHAREMARLHGNQLDQLLVQVAAQQALATDQQALVAHQQALVATQQRDFEAALTLVRNELTEKAKRAEAFSLALSRLAQRAAASVGASVPEASNESTDAEIQWAASVAGMVETLWDQAIDSGKSGELARNALQAESGLLAARAKAAEMEARFLATEVSALRHSTSWRVTRPLRSLSRFLKDPRREIGEIRRWLRPRSGAAPLPVPVPGSVSAAAPLHPDLTWAEFSDRVLSKRDQFRGVFVQEMAIDWDVPLYQRPQHICAAMTRLGYLVIYRTGNWAGDNVNGFREVLPNLWLTNSAEVDLIPSTVRSIYSTAYAYSPARVSEFSDSNVIVYEYIDHIDPQISGDSDNIARLVNLKDWAFAGGADIVVASAAALAEEAVAAVGESRVIVAQNGVDTLHYRNTDHDQVEIPAELVEFRKKYSKVVGYFGAIAPWLWYEGIQALTKARPDIGFVFIGPDYYGGVKSLPTDENVLYLGSVNYKILPAYAKQFDVCFIPFEPGEIARTTSPLKLFEYFALERPVVVTAWMNECVAHPEVYRGSSVAELSQAIDAAFAVKDDPAMRRRYAEMADENSWNSRAEAISAAFDLLGRR